jgi:hypothetical protein
MMQYVWDRNKDELKTAIKKDAGNSFGPILKDHFYSTSQENKECKFHITLTYKTH